MALIIERMKQIRNEQSQKMLYFGLAVLMFVLPIPQFFGPDDVKAIGVQTTILNLFLFFFLRNMCD